MTKDVTGDATPTHAALAFDVAFYLYGWQLLHYNHARLVEYRHLHGIVEAGIRR